ncbi:MAG: hypothetical protein H6706_03865 [Myxococcales bacterium]|nr:hypothetical protein [Myxococcales bacterium]
MKTQGRVSLLLGLLAAQAAWAQSPEVYTAAADTFVQVDDTTSNYGGWQVVWTKVSGTLSHRRYTLLRFTRTGSGAVDNAVLRMYLTATGAPDPTFSFEVWGLKDGADCETFAENSSTNWSTCDVFGDGDLNRASDTLFDGDPHLVGTQSLGTFETHADDPAGSLVVFSSEALADFVEASTNDVITLVIARTTTGGITAFASKEHASLAGPVLSLNEAPPIYVSTLTDVDHDWTPSGVDAAAMSGGILLGQAVSYNGSDPGVVRLRPNGLLRFQESENGTHDWGEEVNVLGLMPELQDYVPVEMDSQVLGQGGPPASFTVTFQNTYTTPVFFAWLRTPYGASPITAWTHQVSATQATVHMAEAGIYDGLHVGETIDWAVFEAGVYDLGPHGILEVGVKPMTNTGVDDFQPIDFATAFDPTAALFVQPQGGGPDIYQGARMRRQAVNAYVLSGIEARIMFDQTAEQAWPGWTGDMGYLAFGKPSGMLPTTVYSETITQETHWAPGAGTLVQSSDARLEWTADANLRLVSNRNGDTMWETGAFGAANVDELVFAPAPAGDGLLRIRANDGSDLWVMESEGQTGHTLGVDGCTVGVANDTTMVWSQSGSDRDCLLARIELAEFAATPYTEPQILLETPEAQLDWKANGDLVLYDRTNGSVLWSWGGFTPTELAAYQPELRFENGNLVAGVPGGQVLRALENPFASFDDAYRLVLARCSLSSMSDWGSRDAALWTVGGVVCAGVTATPVPYDRDGSQMEKMVIQGDDQANDIVLVYDAYERRGTVWADGIIIAVASDSIGYGSLDRYEIDAGPGDDAVVLDCRNASCGTVRVWGGSGTDYIEHHGMSGDTILYTDSGVGDVVDVTGISYGTIEVNASGATGSAIIKAPGKSTGMFGWKVTCKLSRYDSDSEEPDCDVVAPFGTGSNVAEPFEVAEERGFGNSNFGAGYAIDVGIRQDGSAKTVGGTPLLVEAKLLGYTLDLIRATAEMTSDNGTVDGLAELILAGQTVWGPITGESISAGTSVDQTFWSVGKSIDLGLLSVTVQAEIVGSAGVEVGAELVSGAVAVNVTPSLALTASADASASFACARAGIAGELSLLSVDMPMSLEVDVLGGGYTATGDLELGSLSGSVRAYASACFVSVSKTLVSFAGFSATIPLFDVSGTAW